MKEKLMKDIINKIEEYDTIAIYRHVFPESRFIWFTNSIKKYN